MKKTTSDTLKEDLIRALDITEKEFEDAVRSKNPGERFNSFITTKKEKNKE